MIINLSRTLRKRNPAHPPGGTLPPFVGTSSLIRLKERPMLRPSGIAAAIALFSAFALDQATGPAAWQNDLTPIAPSDWNRDFAAHLLERAGFGGTPEEIDALAKLTPAQANAGM